MVIKFLEQQDVTDNDTISRQATIKAIQNHFNPTGAELSPDLASVLAGVGVVINTMPSSPSRPHGKWINIREGNRADCDQCGQSGRAWMNFCFDCGADMRGGTA